jgi:hypothetical protein
MQRGANFSRCGTYRYALRRCWDAARPPALIVGLNPSTADAERDDPTIRRCVRFARDWGFGGVVVGNLFAYRATRPAALRAAPAPVGPANDRWLRALTREAGIVVAAWGDDGRHGGRDRAVLRLLGAAHCLGTTKAGAPRHPLYVRADVAPRPFAGRGAAAAGRSAAARATASAPGARGRAGAAYAP